MKQLTARKLFTFEKPKSSIAEAFRMLRTNLMYTDIDKKMKLIMVTSSGPAEGKSTVLANLGVALAQTGKKILIIDCDLRRPVQHEVFSVSNQKGVTNYITGYCSFEEAVLETQIPDLYVMPSGPIPPNPSELLGSKVMENLLHTVKEHFDLILIDAPPVMAVADPLIIGPKCDGVLMVVRSGQTKIQLLKDTREALEKAQLNVIGAVLNDVNRKKQGYGYYGKYYARYYDSYYEK